MAYDSPEKKAAHSRAYYAANKEKLLAAKVGYHAERKARIPEWYMLAGAKTRTKEKSLPACNLTCQDIVIPEVCPVLGLTLVVSKGVLSDTSPSLDRIVPALGYVKGNVRVISYRANRLKCDATIAELELVLADMRKL